MTDSLFFAYSKPKDPGWWHHDDPKPEECPACGSLITVGSWPFCPHDQPKNRKESE